MSLPLSCEACLGRRFQNTQFWHNPCLSHLDLQSAGPQRTVAEETELTAVTGEHAILCMYTPLTYTACIRTYVRTYSYCTCVAEWCCEGYLGDLYLLVLVLVSHCHESLLEPSKKTAATSVNCTRLPTWLKTCVWMCSGVAKYSTYAVPLLPPPG